MRSGHPGGGDVVDGYLYTFIAYRRTLKLAGELQDFLGGATTTSQLTSGKERKVVNFFERKLRTTNAKDEKSRGEVGRNLRIGPETRRAATSVQWSVPRR